MAVSVGVVGTIATITVDRPEARNALTFAMYDELYDTCERLEAEPAVRVVVLRGGGRTFIAGTDIGEFVALQSAADALAYERRVDRVVGRVESLAKPTIAMIEGFATGGGLTLALACDLRYAAEDAQLGIPIARTLGNCLSMANYARLLDAVGPARARELLMTARLLGAAEAQAIGLLNGVWPADELEARVREVAETITRHAPLTIQASKEALRRIQASRREVDGADLIVRCYTSQDFQGAVRAFLDKRTPTWTGR